MSKIPNRAILAATILAVLLFTAAMVHFDFMGAQIQMEREVAVRPAL